MQDAALARVLVSGKPPAVNLGNAPGPPGGFGGGGPGGGAGMGLPVSLQKLINADLAALKAGRPLPTATHADLRSALDELEKAGRYNHFWNAYLWRKS